MNRAQRLQLALVLALSVFTLAADASPDSLNSSIEKQFVTGGRIDLNLSAGGYVIRGTPDNRISIELNASQAPHVRADIKVEGNHARVDVNGPEHNFQATIYIPQRTDLVISQSVGDLRIQAVEGNKDIDLNVGSLKVDVPKAADYANVDATVRVGSLKAPAWNAQRDGFFRSLQTHGQGKYSLNAHVGVGDMTLSEAERL
jgi:hypothetical protein